MGTKTTFFRCALYLYSYMEHTSRGGAEAEAWIMGKSSETVAVVVSLVPSPLQTASLSLSQSRNN